MAFARVLAVVEIVVVDGGGPEGLAQASPTLCVQFLLEGHSGHSKRHGYLSLFGAVPCVRWVASTATARRVSSMAGRCALDHGVVECRSPRRERESGMGGEFGERKGGGGAVDRESHPRASYPSPVSQLMEADANLSPTS